MNSLKVRLLSLPVMAAIVSLNSSSVFAEVSGLGTYDTSSARLSRLREVSIIPQRLSFNLPNLQPRAAVNGDMLQVDIPVSLFEGPINEILRANQGRYKDTEFQRMDVSDMKVSFGNGGFTIDGNWRFQAREYLGKIFGKKKHTPWTSISGSFAQGFNVNVSNGRLVAQAGKTDIRGADKWYGDIVNAVVSRMGVNGTVNQLVNKELESINGMNVQQLVVKAGSDQVARSLNISSSAASQLINSRSGGINANISGGRLQLTVKVR